MLRIKYGHLLLGLSVIFMVFGLWRHEALLVLDKAITICLQCIGIG